MHNYRRLYEIYATQIYYIFYLSSMNNTREVFLTMYTMTALKLRKYIKKSVLF